LPCAAVVHLAIVALASLLTVSCAAAAVLIDSRSRQTYDLRLVHLLNVEVRAQMLLQAVLSTVGALNVTK
jgi:hypothetical protein